MGAQPNPQSKTPSTSPVRRERNTLSNRVITYDLLRDRDITRTARSTLFATRATTIALCAAQHADVATGEANRRAYVEESLMQFERADSAPVQAHMQLEARSKDSTPPAPITLR